MTLSIDAVIEASKIITSNFATATTKSNFSNQSQGKGVEDMNLGQFLMFCFILFVMTYFIMFIGAMLFNMSIVKLKIFPNLKEITPSDFLCLYIVTHLLFC